MLVTSVGLTPPNKDELLECLSPYVASSEDIYGRDEVNSLLRKHPSVEKSNFKLWLTSTAIMQRVLHNAQQCQTEFEVDRVMRRLPIFVQSNAFPRAQRILEENRIVIISGMPGIGKTTLADLLLYSHLEREYKPVVIQDKLADARRLFERNTKQIFYFDDFLGQTFLHDRPDMLGSNQDAALVSFMEAVRNTPRSRFILTTREHILRSAIAFSERLYRSEILTHRCLLKMEDYSVSQRARILYNHLYFSDLPDAYKREVLTNDFFLKIVKHLNFNPRLMEWLSGYSRIREVPHESYRRHIRQLLDNPENIWKYAFRHQLSEASQTVLLALASLGGACELIDLEPAWKALYDFRSEKYNFKTTSHDYRQALNDLDNSFIKIGRSRIELLNPSIRDFIENIFLGGDEVEDIIESAIRFRQLGHLFHLGQLDKESKLKDLASERNRKYVASLDRLLLVPHLRWNRTKYGEVGTAIDSSLESRLIWLIELAEEKHSRPLLKLATKLYEYFVESWNTRRVSVDAVAQIEVLKELDRSSWVRKVGPKNMRTKVLDGVISQMSYAPYYEWSAVLSYQRDGHKLTKDQRESLEVAIEEYETQGAQEDLDGCESENDVSDFYDTLEELEREYGLALSSVRELASERLAGYEYQHSFDEDRHWYRGSPASSNKTEVVNDEEIRNMFRTLV